MRIVTIVVLLIVGMHSPAWAQLVAAADGPVVYGHHHINVTSVAAHRAFWIDALGGTSIRIGTSTAEVVRFPNVYVFLSARVPVGGTKGTTVNHVGFETPNLRAAVDRLKAAGFPIVTAAEVPADYTVTDGLAQRPGGNVIAFVMGPDETKVELIENRAVRHPIVLHHLHFAAADPPAMQAWYVKTFGARAGSRIGQHAADLPGVNLTFAPAPAAVVPTRGRALDHVGFEVRNLEEFCRQLEKSGVTFDRPYTTVPSLGIAIAFLTDPWGTYIELTEGLASIPSGQAATAPSDIRGGWQAESYTLKTGERHTVQGRIFFTATEWGVTFFVTLEGQAPQRASAEGGTYTLNGDKLVFSHHYNFSAGSALPGLPASPMRMTMNDRQAAPAEPVTLTLDGERLTIAFPSGNAMTFRRSSRP